MLGPMLHMPIVLFPYCHSLLQWMLTLIAVIIWDCQLLYQLVMYTRQHSDTAYLHTVVMCSPPPRHLHPVCADSVSSFHQPPPASGLHQGIYLDAAHGQCPSITEISVTSKLQRLLSRLNHHVSFVIISKLSLLHSLVSPWLKYYSIIFSLDVNIQGDIYPKQERKNSRVNFKYLIIAVSVKATLLLNDNHLFIVK